MQNEGTSCTTFESSPPWFIVTLADPISNDIEVRICGDESILTMKIPQ